LNPATEDCEALPKTLKEAREQLERRMILAALRRHKGGISEASRELGLSDPPASSSR
jgi:DNA-binding NtrC family response regulator